MEYQNEIYSHMLSMQQLTGCDPHMIDLQPELEWHMRPYLLDFLVESHLGLQLNPETLFLAVNIIDRYSSKRIIYKRHYQLVACSSLWIASKYQDKKSRIPTLQELNMLCCGAYENHMFVQMESHILFTLEWTISHPTEDMFVDMYLRDYPGDANTVAVIKNIALYICELAMFHKSLLIFPCSVIASCASELACLIFNSISHYGYHNIFGWKSSSSSSSCASTTSTSETHCIDLLANVLLFPTTCLQRKYSQSQFGQAYTLAARFLAMKWPQQQSMGVTIATPLTPEESGDDSPRYVPEILVKTYHRSVRARMYPANSYYMTPPVSPGDVSI